MMSVINEQGGTTQIIAGIEGKGVRQLWAILIQSGTLQFVIIFLRADGKVKSCGKLCSVLTRIHANCQPIYVHFKHPVQSRSSFGVFQFRITWYNAFELLNRFPEITAGDCIKISLLQKIFSELGYQFFYPSIIFNFMILFMAISQNNDLRRRRD